MAARAKRPRLLPPAGTPPGPALLWAIGVATAAATALVVALALGNPDLYQRPLRILLVLWVLLPFVGAGAIAWRRRPDSRFGPLLIVAGFVLLVSTFQWASQPVVNTAGQLCDLLLPALWLHVFLAYPSGRLTGRPERVIVVAGYVAALGLQLVVMMLGGFGAGNLLAVTARPVAAEAVQNVQLLTLAALSLAGAVVLWWRQRQRWPAPRRAVALLVDTFGAALVVIAALLVAGTFALPGFETLRLVAFGMVGLAPLAFLAGLLEARLARSGVAELVVRLNDGARVDLPDLLAGVLRDPTLTVAYWLPQREVWADQTGRPVTLPGPDDARIATVIGRDGTPVAALLHDRALLDEPELLDGVTAAAAIALENASLQAELRAGMQELHSSRARVIEAAQDERRRLERNLHDGAQQRLIALALELRMLEERLDGDADLRGDVGRARREVMVSLDELRDIARGIHPAVVSGHGLAVALESLAARTPSPVVDLTLADIPRLPEPVEVAAYYVVCECLANVAKHAGTASCRVDVQLRDLSLVVEVSDDGPGGADPGAGSGLRGLADRVEALDGRLDVRSVAGHGTRVRAELPCG
jgi:signal transduction histidine kinase